MRQIIARIKSLLKEVSPSVHHWTSKSGHTILKRIVQTVGKEWNIFFEDSNDKLTITLPPETDIKKCSVQLTSNVDLDLKYRIQDNQITIEKHEDSTINRAPNNTINSEEAPDIIIILAPDEVDDGDSIPIDISTATDLPGAA